MGKSITELILSGDLLVLARFLTEVEENSPKSQPIMDELFHHTGKAHIIGITGAPGTGKSTLVNQLTLKFRSGPDRKRVAIVAVDPSSPFTGGAVLGDRVRMRDLAGDPGVFIRSMATRGSLGGLARATSAMVQVFDAAGYEVVLIETVGAGQTEVDIARLAHTTLVVEAPGLGDEIQAIKAGILEIADILVVNKADLPGAERTRRTLKGMLGLAHPVDKFFRRDGQGMKMPDGQTATSDFWVPPILSTISTDGTGVGKLLTAIGSHAGHLHQSGEWDRRERFRLETELETLLTETMVAKFHARIPDQRYNELVDRLVQRTLSPREAVKALLD